MTKRSISVPANDLKALFDIAVGSMDFGSGMLDDDEVKALRRVADFIGVDPMEGTPSNFVKKYAHGFAGREVNQYDWTITDPFKRQAAGVRVIVCKYCTEPEDAICHTGRE